MSYATASPRRATPCCCFNWRLLPGQSIRAFPLSNWTEHDIWLYILACDIELASLYVAREHSVVMRDGMRIVVDDPARMRFLPGESPMREHVRFRTLGCWPVTAAQPSTAADLASVFIENQSSGKSERFGRVGDERSLERQKREGYF